VKFAIALIVAAALAGPAAAQIGFGSEKPKQPWGSRGPTMGSASKPSTGYGVPATPSAPAYGGATTARIYSPPAAPKAEPFKPYQPYKPNSVFGPDRQKKR